MVEDSLIDTFAKAVLESFGAQAHVVASQQVSAALAANSPSLETWTAILSRCPAPR
jgi:hypothetical protein